MELDRKITLKFNDLLGDTFEFETLEQFIDFVENESMFWKKSKEVLLQLSGNNTSHVTNFFNVADTFDRCLNEINNWSKLDKWDQNTLNQNISNIDRNYLKQIERAWISSNNPVTIKFIELCNETNFEKAHAFLDYFSQSSSLNPNNRERFEGALYAYEFTLPDTSLLQRVNAEKTVKAASIVVKVIQSAQ